MILQYVYNSLVCFMGRQLDIIEKAETWESYRVEVKLLHSSAVGP